MTRFENWILGWLIIAEKIVLFFSFARIRPQWGFRYFEKKIEESRWKIFVSIEERERNLNNDTF